MGDVERAFLAAVCAGESASAAHAPAEALTHFTFALECGQSSPDIDQTVLIGQTAEAASAAGHNARAAQLAREALGRLDPRAEPARLALQWERLGRYAWLNGDLDASWNAYDQALRVVPDRPSVARARVLAAKAQSLMLRCRHLSAWRHAEQAAALARDVGAEAEEAHATDTLGTSLVLIGRHDEGIEAIKTALRLSRETGDDIEVSRCFINLGEELVAARRLT